MKKGALLLLVLAGIAGASIGGLMTWHHDVQMFGDASLQGGLIGCEASAEVNCDIVNTSEYSEFLGVPIATWGIATYLLVAGLAGLAAAGRQAMLKLLLVIGTAATLYSGFLFGISKLQLSYVCAWCMRLYGINLSIPVLSLLAGAWSAPRPSGKVIGSALAAFVLLSAASIGSERAFRASLLGDEAGGTRLAEVSDTPTERTGPQADPTGTLSARTMVVTTEDKNEVTLTVRPDDAWKGNPDAEVMLVEFADLECGYCKRTSGQLKRLVEAYSDDVLFVFKHYPMDPSCNPGVKNRKHRDACKAAMAAVCAQQQGRFWAFHDLAFKNQHQLKDDNLRTYAESTGADMTAFDACMRDPATKQAVVSDAEDGAAVDVHGTPRIFIDGRLYRSGSSAEQMAVAIERALGRDAATARAAAKAVAEESLSISPIPDDLPPMQRITLGSLDFLIDTFESSLSVEGSTAKALQGRHLIPATQMSWYAASEACAAAGKRMCTEAEWLAACQSAEPVDDDGNGQFADDMVEGNSYPYADYHSPGRCWDGHERGSQCGEEKDQPCRPVYTGELPGCVTPGGVYDLTGNVEEWVGESPERAVLLGGAFDTSDDHARCYRRNDTYGPGFANVRTGFRCCQTP
jgi:protein-disulfide isomerase/uncharacterized membrane protein